MLLGKNYFLLHLVLCAFLLRVCSEKLDNQSKLMEFIGEQRHLIISMRRNLVFFLFRKPSSAGTSDIEHVSISVKEVFQFHSVTDGRLGSGMLCK